MQKTSIHTFIKLLTAGFIFYVLSLIGGNPSMIVDFILNITHDMGLVKIMLTSLFAIFFTANIIWASVKKNKLLLLISPVVYLAIQIILFIFFAPFY